MKKFSHDKIKAIIRRIDKPSFIVSCVGMAVVLGVAGYAHALKARLEAPAPHVAAIKSVAPSATPTPSVKPSPTPTPSTAPAPAVAPTTRKTVSRTAVTYVTQTAPQSSVSGLQPHTTAPSSPSPSPSTAPGTANVPPSAAVSYTSSNWAGYLATGDNYTGVSGSWTVPSPTGNGTSTTADAAWVGIGGVTTNDLIQAGTLDSVSASGQVTVYAFYEILPASARLLSMPVSPGDSMSASVTETAPSIWLVTITDQTTGQTFTKSISYASTHSSAEWIEEDPSTGGGQQMAFDNFGSVPFAAGSMIANGASVTIAGGGGLPITMMSGSTPVATPSAVSGGSFTVTRGS